MPKVGPDECPLCGLDASGVDIPDHIRHRCPIAKRIRVEEMALPEDGYGGTVNRSEIPDRDAHGKFVARGETA